MTTRRPSFALLSGLALVLADRTFADTRCRTTTNPVPGMYVGAGACASQNCHGGTAARADGERSLQNEFITWYQHDRHARAYVMLESDLGKQIGVRLDKDPTHWVRCLSCHATNAPADQADSPCRIADGVTCESCHGPASGWLEKHTEKSWKPDEPHDDLRMVDTTRPEVMAEICVDCHIGDGDLRRVDHELLAAGHPPLAFELDAFAVNMPAHWTHRERAGKPVRNHRWFDGTAWAAGQVVAARRAATLFADQVRTSGWPDFAAYDCQSCHHAYTRGTWVLRGRGGRPPLDGARRPGMDALVRVGPPARSGSSAIGELANVAVPGPSDPAVERAIEAVRQETKTLHETVRSAPSSEERIVQLMKTITALADETARLGFRSAQQAAWALDSLVDARSALRHADFDRKAFPEIRAAIRRLYAGLDDPRRYDPVHTAQSLKAVGTALE
jgi:hypothetical protein